MKKLIFILPLLLIFTSCDELKKVKHNAKLIDKTLILGKTKVELYELQNGLKIAISENRKAPVFSFKLLYKVGSRKEKKRKGQDGLTHMLEHLMFKGTKDFPQAKVEEITKLSGAEDLGAYTWKDQTCYYVSLPSENMENFIKIEADRMKNVIIEPAVLENEKNIVLSELKTRGKDNPDMQLIHELEATAFLKHPYKNPVIGTEDSIKKFTVDGVYEYYNTYYAPNNALIVLVGDLDTDKTLSLIEKYFSGIPPSKLPEDNLPTEPNQNGERVKKMWVDVQRIAIKMAYHIPLATDPDLPALEILSAMLSSGRNSKLKNELFDKGLASASAGLATAIDPYLFFVSMTVLQKGQWRNAMEIYDKIIDDIAKNGMDENELSRVINLYMTSFYSTLQSNKGVADLILDTILYYDNLEEVNNSWLALKNVTSADIQRVAKKYLMPNNRTIVYGFPRS